MKKGINQWCYPEGTPLDRVLEWTKQAGFSTIELNVAKQGEVGLTLDTTVEEAKAIKTQIKAAGLEMDSLSTSLLWQTPLSSGDEKIREQGKHVVRRMLEFAHDLDVSTILVVPGMVTEDVRYDECYERSIAALKELAPLAEEVNVRIGIENVWNRFLLSPLEMAQYIDEVNSTHVGAYFDVGNVLQFGYPEQWIRILGERIFKVHVKDFKTSVGAMTGFTNLLAGDVNWQAVMKELQEIGYNGELTAELTPYAYDPAALAYDTSRQMDLLLASQITPYPT
ncbi:sugar phosphate isomerase/epimerase family protein [Shouchella lehensis]|uniref:Sugar phosphate isomerase/epimerase n=1 Tax=Shouchella lehensis TaxID=300825 RepID=A0A4Y7WFV8_9BACI|nr:sugar phosphate isomerase/epimerase family protein [Shouchella lehensis]MBG9785077.1 xylulose 5-phosphate 3-epimerase [Shouchella lehensis]RQW18788.1 sugar phosphate isomerase/epimerase [Bacillus sp. C1-1]TES46507.1 sugar phosphate isomerase/epimerase [Shouchella lehensis]